MDYLDFIVTAQKSGEARGLTSICSAHPLVLEAALRHGLERRTPVLIEATCNQVNQYGGYTGMTPADFMRLAREIAGRVDFPPSALLLGGDHLGPLVWSNEPAEAAMEKARRLVRDYALAGFGKIHLDCSVPCADDDELPVETIARRAAELAAVADTACAAAGLPLPHYVIGSEVPPAGGAKAAEHMLTITDPAEAARTIELTRQAFTGRGLGSAWERVVALVVQPGVEFGDESIHEYDRAAAAGLARFIETVSGLIYEAHSTDYQTRPALRALVEDHFAILKVGPGLTFAFREAVFALAEMEEILVEHDTSRIRETLEMRMQANPAHWQKHYGGSPRQQRISRLYSFSDRIRYYWSDPEVQKAFKKLLKNLGDAPLPLSLVSEFLPRQYEKIRAKELSNHPRALLLGRVGDVLDDYAFACGLSGWDRSGSAVG
jgi:D-tagatose-1,6-bisphosphate aldolase subunit GatZ/KbaZ